MSKLEATLMVGPDAADGAEVRVHAAGYRDDLTIGSVRIDGLTIQTNWETGPEDLAAFFDALAATVRDAHALFLARTTEPETGDRS